MMVTGNFYQCKHVKTMTAGQCLKCLEEKSQPQPNATPELREAIEEILLDGQGLFLKDTMTNEQIRYYEADQILTLFQAREQQAYERGVLIGNLEGQEEARKDLAAQNKTNDGGRNGGL